MGLIKAEQTPVAQLGAFSMADIEKQARAILAAAHAKAQRLLNEAQVEAEDIKRHAYAESMVQGRKEGLARGIEEGRNQGRDQALAERRQELAQLAETLTQSAQELDRSRIELESQARQAVVELAIAISERVTRRQGALDPQVLLANVEDALKLVVHGVDVRIAVHPSQEESLAGVLPALQARWPDLQHVELIADGTLAPGGCRVFSGGGHVDADLELQLARITAELVPSPGEEA